jgi:hypothetical protein
MNPELDIKRKYVDNFAKQEETIYQMKRMISSQTIHNSYNVFDNLKNSSQYTNLNSFMQEIHNLNQELVKRKFDNYNIPYNSTDVSDLESIEPNNKKLSDYQITKTGTNSNFENNFFNVKPITKLLNENISEKENLKHHKHSSLNNSYDSYKLHKLFHSDTEANTPERENDELSNNLKLNENNHYENKQNVNNRNNNEKVYYSKKLIDFDLKHNSQIASQRFKKTLVKKLFKDSDNKKYKRINTENLFKNI